MSQIPGRYNGRHSRNTEVKSRKPTTGADGVSPRLNSRCARWGSISRSSVARRRLLYRGWQEIEVLDLVGGYGSLYWATLTPRSFARRTDCCPRVGRCTRRVASGSSAPGLRAVATRRRRLLRGVRQAAPRRWKSRSNARSTRRFPSLRGARRSVSRPDTRRAPTHRRSQFRDEFEPRSARDPRRGE